MTDLKPPANSTTGSSTTGSNMPGRSLSESVPSGEDFLPATRPQRRRTRMAVAAAVVVAIVVAVVAFRAEAGPSGPLYRTAKVSTQSVSQTLDAVATVAPVDQASVAFPVSGTVATVDVQIGDVVTVGQILATLDPSSLLASVNERQAALDQANLNLSKALNGESVTGTGGSGASDGSGGFEDASPVSADTMVSGEAAATSATYATDSSSADWPAGTAAVLAQFEPPTQPTQPSPTSDLAGAQQAVLDAQKKVDQSMIAAQAALANATQICASTPDDAAIAACQAALQDVLAAQQRLAGDQEALDVAVQNLTAMLEPSAGDGGQGVTGGTDTSGGFSPPVDTTTSAGGTGSGEQNPSSSTPSADDLIAYQKAVDAAEVDLEVANQALAQATIVSSIDGTVVDVNFAVGDSATSGSTTQNIVVVGEGGYELTTNVSVTDLSDVEVGQEVLVTPDATGTALDGEVVRIGVIADDGTNYPVTIGVTGDASGLRNGSVASVSIITDAAVDALAVPTSAITTDGTRHTVTVVDGDSAREVEVGVGAIGSNWTEIISGLDEGQEVVLADVKEPLPGGATDSSGSGSTGQFPGGGPQFVVGGGPPGG